MGIRFISLIFAVASLLFFSPASASGDGGCTVEWKLINPTMRGCDNLSALAPGNDTRVNLLLLLFDRYGTPPERLSAHSLPGTDPFVDGWRTSRARFFSPRFQNTTEYADGEGS